jgi:hypothetical protein
VEPHHFHLTPAPTPEPLEPELESDTHCVTAPAPLKICSPSCGFGFQPWLWSRIMFMLLRLRLQAKHNVAPPWPYYKAGCRSWRLEKKLSRSHIILRLQFSPYQNVAIPARQHWFLIQKTVKSVRRIPSTIQVFLNAKYWRIKAQVVTPYGIELYCIFIYALSFAWVPLRSYILEKVPCTGTVYVLTYGQSMGIGVTWPDGAVLSQTFANVSMNYSNI